MINRDEAQTLLLEAEQFLLRPVWLTDDGDEYVVEHVEGELARTAHTEEGKEDAKLIVTVINKLPELCRTVIEQAEGLERFQRVCDEALPREYIACPSCGKQHVEGARFDKPEIDGRTRPHHTHRCYHCGHVWDSGRWSFGADVPKPWEANTPKTTGPVLVGIPLDLSLPADSMAVMLCFQVDNDAIERCMRHAAEMQEIGLLSPIYSTYRFHEPAWFSKDPPASGHPRIFTGETLQDDRFHLSELYVDVRRGKVRFHGFVSIRGTSRVGELSGEWFEWPIRR